MDLDKRVITLLGPAERRGETTEIRYIERDGDRVILGGVEAGRPWSIVLWESDGRMTLTANVDDAGWVAFGQCMAAGQFVP